MAPNPFRILLALVALYALLRGRRDERRVGFILVVGVIATHLVISPEQHRFHGPRDGGARVDLAVFAGFLWVALRSERFWPLWIAGLQLTTLFGHALKAFDAGLFSWAYGAALAFWGYPIVLILADRDLARARRRIRARRLRAAPEQLRASAPSPMRGHVEAQEIPPEPRKRSTPAPVGQARGRRGAR